MMKNMELSFFNPHIGHRKVLIQTGNTSFFTLLCENLQIWISKLKVLFVKNDPC